MSTVLKSIRYNCCASWFATGLFSLRAEKAGQVAWWRGSPFGPGSVPQRASTRFRSEHALAACGWLVGLYNRDGLVTGRMMPAAVSSVQTNGVLSLRQVDRATGGAIIGFIADSIRPPIYNRAQRDACWTMTRQQLRRPAADSRLRRNAMSAFSRAVNNASIISTGKAAGIFLQAAGGCRSGAISGPAVTGWRSEEWRPRHSGGVAPCCRRGFRR